MTRTITTIIFYLFISANIFAQTDDSSLKISNLTGDFYIFTTYHMYQGSRISANGMYVVSDSGVVMIDTPWDTTQFQPLLNSIRTKHNKNVILCIATHFHEDRTGGLEYYSNQGIRTFTTKQTDDLSKKRGMKRAQYLIYKDTVFKVGQYSFQTYYPGPGHTADNIVIWFSKQKILYGGCLIKSTDVDDLGNLADAYTKEYSAAIKRLQIKFGHPNYIIPGHDDWHSKESLEHTLELANQLENKSQH
jgi:metallo-beta-lactamase class B